ncbi:hypothetical protein B0H16DRAFT_1498525 [Mycena metata]|uniref:Uncharacterized protein n=1 Tax=Mycena metata TaxID=1033252 RepID=A0AAD7KC29_9AGAR|nr:hypothetical protein B0H16DRAFT_1498525 [Mycena metata]
MLYGPLSSVLSLRSIAAQLQHVLLLKAFIYRRAQTVESDWLVLRREVRVLLAALGRSSVESIRDLVLGGQTTRGQLGLHAIGSPTPITF